MTYNDDTADRAHRILDLVPEHHRTAVAALLDLPPDYVVGRDSTGDISAALLIHSLRATTPSPPTR